MPAHNLLAVLGDFSAHLDVGDATFIFHDTTDRNGEYLVDLMQRQ